MKAIILAAGRGERMKPLTDNCPKPLLKVKGVPLIEYHISKLAHAGIDHIVINHAWLGKQIENTLGDGSRWGIKISYSAEGQQALETAGGIIKALPLLGSAPFLVINGDIFTDFDMSLINPLSDEQLAHLWLVENPEHNRKGDFLIRDGLLKNLAINDSKNGSPSYTYCGIALFHPNFFNDDKQGCEVLRLAPMLRKGADEGKISASLFSGSWTDVGTPERLQQLNEV